MKFPRVNATQPHKWEVNLGSGTGLVPSGNKPLTEPMSTQIYVVTGPLYGVTTTQEVKIVTSISNSIHRVYVVQLVNELWK